jgi:hypothetical protein
MPPLPPVADVLKARMHWILGEDTQAVTVLHYRYSGSALTSTDLAAFGANINAAVVSNMLPLLHPSNTYAGCDLEDLASPTGAIATAAATHPGTSGGGMLAASTATVVSFKIHRRYRGGKPRAYLPIGTAASMTDAQLWNNTHISAAAGAMNQVNTDIVGTVTGSTSVVIQCSVSYYHGFIVTPPEPITGRVRTIPLLRITPLVDDVAGWVTNKRPGSQRRRNLQGS